MSLNSSFLHPPSLLASSCKLGKKSSTLQTGSEQQLPPNSKLNPKQLFKLAMRLIQMYNLKLGRFAGEREDQRNSRPPRCVIRMLPLYSPCPDMFLVLSEKKASASLHYLLHKKYVEVRHESVLP